MKIEPARTFDYSIFVYDISKATTLLRFEPKWNVLDGITDMVEECECNNADAQRSIASITDYE